MSMMKGHTTLIDHLFLRTSDENRTCFHPCIVISPLGHRGHRELFAFSRSGDAHREKPFSRSLIYRINETAVGMMVFICPAYSGANKKLKSP